MATVPRPDSLMPRANARDYRRGHPTSSLRAQPWPTSSDEIPRGSFEDGSNDAPVHGAHPWS